MQNPAKTAGHRQWPLQSGQPRHRARAVLHLGPGRAQASAELPSTRPTRWSWFESLGLYTRTDEAGRVYPYSNQAADVLALLEHHLEKYNVRIRCGCTVRSLSQSRGGYAVQIETMPRPAREPAGGRRHLCHGRGRRAVSLAPMALAPPSPPSAADGWPPSPCLTALQIAKPQKALAGIRAKATASPAGWQNSVGRRDRRGSVYGLRPLRHLHHAAVRPAGPGPWAETARRGAGPLPRAGRSGPCRLFAARPPRLAGDSPAEFWLGLVHPKLGRALWAAARLPETSLHALPPQWQKLARTAKHWRFEGLTPLRLEAGPDHRRRPLPQRNGRTVPVPGLPGPLYFVGETLDCAGSCGGFNLHWAFGSGLVAGRSAAKPARPPKPSNPKKKR